jgi:hypothetical protein
MKGGVETPSISANCQFVANRTMSKTAAGGGAVYIDGASSLNITNAAFLYNECSGRTDGPGQAVCDATTGGRFGPVWNGHVRSYYWWRVPYGTDPELLQSRSYGKRIPPSLGVEPVFLSLIENTEGHRRFQPADPSSMRTINAIVLHHVSAINWDKPDVRSQFGPQLDEFERENSPVDGVERKYDWRYCKKIFELYDVSSHYLIDRQGRIFQLVKDEDIAFHAGEARMPPPDHREGINDFSLGVELIATHPDDDPAVKAKPDLAYTPEQYEALHRLLVELAVKYRIPLSSIVGHDDITARKKDPGTHFKRKEVLKRLADELKQLGAL